MPSASLASVLRRRKYVLLHQLILLLGLDFNLVFCNQMARMELYTAQLLDQI
jgi:hypothetical protein